VTRAANLALVWTGAVNGWQPPGLFTPREATYPGHFNSASTPTGTDDQLLEANGAPLELDFLNEPLLGAWFEITPRSGTNSLFEVIIQAFGSDNLSLGTYTLTETAGGTGGVCTGLSATPPVPCTTTGSGAPYVGFYDPEGRIRSIYITVINPSYPNTPLAFAIDSLALDPVPEPAAPWMIGAGLAAIAFYGRKRRVRRIVSE